MAKNLFAESNISYGAQAQFHHKWTEWMKSNKQQNKFDNNAASTQQTTGDLQIPQQTHAKPTGVSSKPQTQGAINLQDILSSGPYGPGVLNHYKAHSSLNDKTRKLLVEAFLHYCAANGIAATKADCQSLSVQITSAFKGEIPVSEN